MKGNVIILSVVAEIPGCIISYLTWTSIVTGGYSFLANLQ